MENSKPNRPFAGEGSAPANVSQGPVAMLVERVAVPAMWFGLGYLAATLIGGGRKTP